METQEDYNELIKNIFYSATTTLTKSINKNKNFNMRIYTLMNIIKDINNDSSLNKVVLNFNKTFKSKIILNKHLLKNISQHKLSNKIDLNIESSKKKINEVYISSRNIFSNKLLIKKINLKNEKTNFKAPSYYINAKVNNNKLLSKSILKEYFTLLENNLNSKSLILLYNTLNTKLNSHIQNDLKEKKDKNVHILKNSKLYFNKNFQKVTINDYEKTSKKTEDCLKTMKVKLNNIMNNASITLQNKVLNSKMTLTEIGLFKFEITNSSIFKVNCFIVNKRYDSIKSITKDIMTLLKTKEIPEKSKDKIITSLEGFVNA